MKSYALNEREVVSENSSKLKKFALFSSLFFFIKGMIWVVVFAGAWSTF